MLTAMGHRGPEGAGFARLDGGALLLGFLKLAFTDEAGGMQPLFNEDEQLALVYNGEIYDYEADRRALQDRGHRLRTRSDSEVLLHRYEEQGEDFIQDLNGEFAFALWDGPRRRLLLARDAYGVKPLFTARRRSAFAFASEAKALLAWPGFSAALEPRWFNGAGLGLPSTERTPFVGITSLRPGHRMWVEASASRVARWWRPAFGGAAGIRPEEARERVRAELARAVARRVGGDVPIALALSSGVDSTAVAALTAQIRPDRSAFTLSYPGAPYDEAAAAGRTAAALGLRFTPVPCPLEALAEGLLPSIYQTEVPTNSLSTVARLRLSAAVRAAGFKALAGGEGSDEIFGGYPYFVLERIWRDLARGAPGAEAALARFRRAEALSRGVFWEDGSAWRRAPPLFGAPSVVHLRALKARPLQRALLSRDASARLGGEGPLDALTAELDPTELRALHPFDATRMVSRSVLGTFAIPALGDRVEMAASLEGRVPYLDAALVRLAVSLPEEICLDTKNYISKIVLRDAVKDLLPPGFSPPPKHTGMAPPFAALWPLPAGRAIFEALLDPAAVRRAALLRPAFVAAVWAAWRRLPQGGARFTALDGVLGYLLSVQALHHAFVERPAASRPTGARLALEDRSPGAAAVGPRA